MTIFQKIALIPGTFIAGTILSWGVIGEFLLSLISSLLIAAANYFLVRHLTRRFPMKKNGPTSS